ncbi:winged helix-turn-helix transcriptional regulator [Jejubacter calystegiae]|uniref:Winged helix-turn-helix transcriptional regulator n=1 Tax=Jejubacter calystegiae TaxID=2579935 RepID=A0A4P8YLS5_9ENTR|nr:helix-turn-helix domain-containing protein [Jejubacter calystegiae]QCT21791.1 winged helix-turn-helix transcriptional regulator [Jejubacter calystegiae]
MNNYETIIKFITENPGSGLAELQRHTRISRSSLTSSLSRLAERGYLWRTRTGGRFIYFESRAVAIQHGATTGTVLNKPMKFGCTNELTALFNRCLAAARSAV